MPPRWSVASARAGDRQDCGRAARMVAQGRGGERQDDVEGKKSVLRGRADLAELRGPGRRHPAQRESQGARESRRLASSAGLVSQRLPRGTATSIRSGLTRGPRPGSPCRAAGRARSSRLWHPRRRARSPASTRRRGQGAVHGELFAKKAGFDSMAEGDVRIRYGRRDEPAENLPDARLCGDQDRQVRPHATETRGRGGTGMSAVLEPQQYMRKKPRCAGRGPRSISRRRHRARQWGAGAAVDSVLRTSGLSRIVEYTTPTW